MLLLASTISSFSNLARKPVFLLEVGHLCLYTFAGVERVILGQRQVHGVSLGGGLIDGHNQFHRGTAGLAVNQHGAVLVNGTDQIIGQTGVTLVFQCRNGLVGFVQFFQELGVLFWEAVLAAVSALNAWGSSKLAFSQAKVRACFWPWQTRLAESWAKLPLG